MNFNDQVARRSSASVPSAASRPRVRPTPVTARMLRRLADRVDGKCTH